MALKLKKSVVTFVKDLLKEFVVCFLAVLLIGNFVIRPIEVKGSSMYPTLEDNNYGLTNVIGRKIGEIERFDIVIIKMDTSEKYLVKRVIGLPGETIEYKDNQLYINEMVVNEDFLDQEYVQSYDIFTSAFGPVTLGNDEYFCLGDNRPHSTDSRYYGAFKDKQITSKGALILYPFKNIGIKSW